MKSITSITYASKCPICISGAFFIVGILAIEIIATAQTIRHNSLSLSDCLSIARRNNPVLSASRAKIRELEADYQTALSSYFPKISLSSHYARLDPGLLSSGNKYGYEVFGGLSINQSLFDGLSTYYNTRASRFGVLAQQQDFQKTEYNVIFSVTSAFYRLLESKENLKVTEDALKQRQNFLAITEAFFKAGKSTRLDFLRAASQATEAEQAKTESAYSIHLAK